MLQAIDEISNLKSMRQLQKEKIRAQQNADELEKRAKIQEYRIEQANLRMKKIEEEEKERCKQTADLLRELKESSNSCSGPFFEKLLGILTNFQGILLYIHYPTKKLILNYYLGGINSVRRTVKCINETLSQLIDTVRTVQDDQAKMSLIIDKLATKVIEKKNRS